MTHSLLPRKVTRQILDNAVAVRHALLGRRMSYPRLSIEWCHWNRQVQIHDGVIAYVQRSVDRVQDTDADKVIDDIRKRIQLAQGMKDNCTCISADTLIEWLNVFVASQTVKET